VNPKQRTKLDGLIKLSSILEITLEDIIKEYQGVNFKDSNVSKYELFLESIDFSYSEASANLMSQRCSLQFHRDSRSSIEYGFDLVLGWIGEDLIFTKLKQIGNQIVLNGNDRMREFLPPEQIGTEADLLLYKNGISRKIEIVISWDNYWKISDQWDLRDSKFKEMIKLGAESVCLGIKVDSCEAFLIDMRLGAAKFQNRRNPAWGNKPVFTLHKISEYLRPIDEVFNRLTLIS
jgi:hypothetical protein